MRKRAKKKHHRQFIFFSASGLIAVIVCIMLNVFPVSADSTHSQTGSVYYTSIEIQPGDTPWNIAEENNDFRIQLRTRICKSSERDQFP